MNPIIKKQLEKCKVANLPYYDDNTVELVISKGSSMAISPYQVHKCYIMELADYIINPPADFTLAANWNNGSVPKSRYYVAEVSQLVGKMIRITGCGYDITTESRTDDIWEGWIPQKGIKLIREIK